MPVTSSLIAAVLAVSQVLMCCCATVSKAAEQRPASGEHACCASEESTPISKAPASHDPASGGEVCSHCGSGSVKVAPTMDAIFATQMGVSQWMPMLSVDSWSGDIAGHLSVSVCVDGGAGPPLAQTLRAQFCLLLI